ncbi:ribonuclease HI [Candidatus Nomurabacteria bacterium RIFOXYC2_FULL_36_8]|nr:MAG: Ribonuclease H [Candidatus Nomurabacteria bacterium GW2011_GWE2_36_115]KKP93729.1 MAG: Ribonuclease H [Candidatus Nomurabacteria bacterium GW2011_GWF2_36_126]KKP97202.1 MAG: Ribonuclease H [Candidatus Nomurabacteria bacterium GW2011_GWD2_36_14]KKP99191.1 MAG: Ribonuclease H [Candidatus Nomurabacteria bacterium GW2011_GWF2_36_19]KKQ05838.1 MAG: Ribonuclease H [Candidatus Nomurabacteria bacterium GW2011_GWF1_36_47]KKQ08637.1 MAG: Ribonuclease H [Candidatus Nomurabacteria bacterium GW2011
MNKTLEIYTDGSSLGNPGPGGWGVVIINNEELIINNEKPNTKNQTPKTNIVELGGGDKNTTNNRMELQAVIEALKYINKNYKENEVTINADSAYVLGGVTTWIHGWEKNGWKTANKKPVLNQELWKELISLVREFKGKINWQKVKGHSGHIYNDKADEIATKYASNQKGN